MDWEPPPPTPNPLELAHGHPISLFAKPLTLRSCSYEMHKFPPFFSLYVHGHACTCDIWILQRSEGQIPYCFLD